ncbi:DUF4389 domain-containing protein [Candidatus Pacearchaeota archaeon]|nr:DUF4389 domain-containing protein [Candidatus Pacearchaeota archaeon]
MANKKMSGRKEAWMRIFVGIISGIVLSVWKVFIQVLAVINWIYAIFTGKRLKDLANLCEIWNTQTYVFLRYMTFVTNERPFPFESLTENFSKFKK